MILDVYFSPEDRVEVMKSIAWVKNKCTINLLQEEGDLEERDLEFILKTDNEVILEIWEGFVPSGVELLDKVNEWEEE
jgi:hypothetical protein